jgi:hypothetical protein
MVFCIAAAFMVIDGAGVVDHMHDNDEPRAMGTLLSEVCLVWNAILSYHYYHFAALAPCQPHLFKPLTRSGIIPRVA